MKQTKRIAVLGGVENAYGQEAAQYSGVILNEFPSLTVQGDKIERKGVRASLTPRGHVIGAKQQGLEGVAELRGGGLSLGEIQPPEFDWMLRACAMVRTPVVRLSLTGASGSFRKGEDVSGGTSLATGTVRDVDDGVVVLSAVTGTFASGETVTGDESGATGAVAVAAKGLEYRPTSDSAAMESSSCKFYRDGILHKLTGCQGTFGLNLQMGSYGEISFNLTGLWNDPTDAAMAMPAESAVTPAVCVGIGLKLDAFVPVAKAVQFSMANKITRRDDINAPEGIKGFRITSREPTGSVDPEVETLTVFNPYAKWKSAEGLRMSCQVGSTPGNIVRVVWTRSHVSEIRYGDRDGLLTYDLPLVFSGDGDDEIILTFM